MAAEAGGGAGQQGAEPELLLLLLGTWSSPAVGDPGASGAGAQGAALRVRRGEPRQQERPPAPVQPGAQEGAGPHPRRPAGVRSSPSSSCSTSTRPGLPPPGRLSSRPTRTTAPRHGSGPRTSTTRYENESSSSTQSIFLVLAVARRLESILRESGYISVCSLFFYVTCLQFFPSWRTLFRSTTEEQRAAAFANVVAAVEPLERAFTECSNSKSEGIGKKKKPLFFGGDAVGLVDVALGSHLVWIKVVDEVTGRSLLDEARFPGLAAWAERFMAVDAVKEAMPDSRKVMEQYQGFLAEWIASAS